MQTEADPLCQPAASLYAEYEARQTLASQAHELSREDLRRTWSVVDVLTSLKRNTSHSPTAALIRRKLDALPLPALDKLGCLVDLTILQRHGHHLSTRHTTASSWLSAASRTTPQPRSRVLTRAAR